ncbi:MAG: molybdopterin-guanine dinucleotide biosynthesis protein B [Candidatus Bathyarchaeia archaeon]
MFIKRYSDGGRIDLELVHLTPTKPGVGVDTDKRSENFKYTPRRSRNPKPELAELPLVLNIIGLGRKRGKTRLIEELTGRLTAKGYRVCTAKHIAEGAFDTPGKDTWRHLRAGASTVIAATPKELIRITPSRAPSLEAALKEVPEGVDVVLVEGFRRSEHPKVIVGASADEVERLLDQVEKVFAITGPITRAVDEVAKLPETIPVLDTDGLLPLVERMILDEALPGLDCRQCGYDSCASFTQAVLRGEATIRGCKTLSMGEVILSVDGRRVPLAAFPQNIIKNTVWGLVRSLKGIGEIEEGRILLEVRGGKEGE